MKKIEDKLLGSYYTPYRTIQFMKEYLAREHKIYGKVLEPSVGDGRFLDAFEKEESIEKIVAVELIEEKVGQLKNRLSRTSRDSCRRLSRFCREDK